MKREGPVANKGLSAFNDRFGLVMILIGAGVLLIAGVILSI